MRTGMCLPTWTETEFRINFMLLNIVSLLYFCVFIAAGQALSRACFAQEQTLIRLMMGGVFALLMLLWLPALVSFAFGFNVLSQCVALALCCVAGLAGYWVSRNKELLRSGILLERPAFYVLVPLFVLGVYLFFTHILNPQGGALHSRTIHIW